MLTKIRCCILQHNSLVRLAHTQYTHANTQTVSVIIFYLAGEQDNSYFVFTIQMCLVRLQSSAPVSIVFSVSSSSAVFLMSTEPPSSSVVILCPLFSAIVLIVILAMIYSTQFYRLEFAVPSLLQSSEVVYGG